MPAPLLDIPTELVGDGSRLPYVPASIVSEVSVAVKDPALMDARTPVTPPRTRDESSVRLAESTCRLDGPSGLVENDDRRTTTWRGPENVWSSAAGTTAVVNELSVTVTPPRTNSA